VGAAQTNPTGPDLARGISVDDLPDGCMLAGHVGNETVLLARRGDEFFAIGATCSHYGGPLAEGLMVEDTVRCPWHHACFSLPTILFNKVTIKGAKQAVQMFGPAQHAVAKAVADSVAEGVIPADEAENLFICAGVFIHWEAADDKKMQDYNYRATKEAIERAVKGEPKVSEVVAKRNQVKHPFAA
jgi:hypothetical protein